MRDKQAEFIAAGGWRRAPKSPLGKSRKMSDGELTRKLIDMGEVADADKLRDAAYAALLKIQDRAAKALGMSFAASAFGLLVYEGALSGFSSSGMQLDKLSFAHAALVAMSATVLWYATLTAQESYIRTWFSAQFSAATPMRRAELQLRYPTAFWYFQFIPAHRGYPPYVFPRRTSYAQVLPVVFVVLALLLFAIGGIALWIAVAMRVWGSAYPSPLASRLTVVACGILIVLAWTVPRSTDVKRWYNHYGLTNLLSKMSEVRRQRAHSRITRARVRMGFFEPDPPAE